MECYCYLRNVHDKMADGKTVFENRYGQTFDRPIPFGTLVERIPLTAKDKSRVHQFGKTSADRQILGLCSTFGRRLVRRLDEDLQESTVSDIYFKSQEVFVKKENTNFRVQTELLDFLVVQGRHC